MLKLTTNMPRYWSKHEPLYEGPVLNTLASTTCQLVQQPAGALGFVKTLTKSAMLDAVPIV